MSDFGWSVESSGLASRTTLCGTTDYLAPEMLNRTGHGLKTDVWCLGVLCYELLYGKPPFEEECLKSTCNRIRKVDFTFPDTRQVRTLAAPCESTLLRKRLRCRYPSLARWAASFVLVRLTSHLRVCTKLEYNIECDPKHPLDRAVADSRWCCRCRARRSTSSRCC